MRHKAQLAPLLRISSRTFDSKDGSITAAIRISSCFRDTKKIIGEWRISIQNPAFPDPGRHQDDRHKRQWCDEVITMVAFEQAMATRQPRPGPVHHHLGIGTLLRCHPGKWFSLVI